MRDRIGTLSYDTETAKKIAGRTSDLPKNDNGYFEEALYKKKTGEYFLAGWGGAESKYGHIAKGDSALTYGSKITPLTFEKAKKWFKDFILDSDDYGFGDEASKKETERIYEREFEPAKDKETIKATFIISVEAKRKLERIATTEGISQTKVIENLIMSE